MLSVISILLALSLLVNAAMGVLNRKAIIYASNLETMCDILKEHSDKLEAENNGLEVENSTLKEGDCGRMFCDDLPSFYIEGEEC